MSARETYTTEDLLKKDPLYIVDVGSSGGVHSRWRKCVPYFKAVLFEPDPREYDKLKSIASDNYIVLNTALSASSTEVDFHLYKYQKASSVYLPNYSFLEQFPGLKDYLTKIRTVKIFTDTLDNQLRENGIYDIGFIKLDTQGSELSILKGALDSLAKTIGLELEVEFVQIYEDQPLFGDVDDFVRRFGFELIDIKRYFWNRECDKKYWHNKKGQIIYGDALYFRSPENICSLSNITEIKILHAIMVYLSYGYFDLAATLCGLTKQKGFLSPQAILGIEMILSKYDRKFLIPEFKGKERMRSILTKIANAFSGKKWYSNDDELGNL